jgi:hypothetical protein
MKKDKDLYGSDMDEKEWMSDDNLDNLSYFKKLFLNDPR